jgi:hypothetical protein
LLVSTGAPAATGQSSPPSIPPPPNVFTSFTEEQLLAQLSERQRALVAAARDSRERFVAFVDASDLQLQSISTNTPTAGTNQSPTLALQLYEATIIAADRRLRSKEAAVRPRDRLYKRFEQRLTKQLGQLKTILLEIAPEHFDAGRAATDTAKRLRLAALASAIDADPNILRAPDDED